MRPAKIVPVLVVGLGLVVLSGCGSGARTFSQLAADASAVPLPGSVTFVHHQQSVEDGPGFTTSTFREVADQYKSSVPCAALESSWADALRRAHRQFKIDNVPHKFGAIGSLGIDITDRPENLGITIGTDDGACATPFVYSFNNPS